MSWQDKVGSGKGRFRTAEFYVDSNTLVGGRRGTTHEFPFKDVPFRDDVGRAGQEFPIQCHVLGSEYLDAKNKLIAELNAPGTGILEHPYYGTVRVAVVTFRVEESTREGGIARFSIQFVESDAQPSQPNNTASGPAKLKASALAVKVSALAEFAARFDPGSKIAAIQTALTGATTALTSVTSKVLSEVQERAQTLQAITAMANNVASLASDGAGIANSFVAIFDRLIPDFLLPNPIGTLLDVYEFDAGTEPPDTTPQRAAEQEGFNATQRLVQRLTLVQTCLVIADYEFEDYDTAVEKRELIAERIDEQAEVVSDDVFSSLQQLRADLVNAVPGDAANLGRLVSYTPSATLPSLVIAHQLYGDATRELEIMARNKTPNPALTLGGRELRVLSGESL